MLAALDVVSGLSVEDVVDIQETFKGCPPVLEEGLCVVEVKLVVRGSHMGAGRLGIAVRVAPVGGKRHVRFVRLPLPRLT